MAESNDLEAGSASVAGAASIIRKADKTRVAAGADLQADRAVLRATIHVTRAKTGKVETWELTGVPSQDAPPTEVNEGS